MKFNIIACINDKLCLGKEQKLIYDIKDDLTNFKRMTIGQVVIMGRKTLESLPNGQPLSNRINIIITNDRHFGEDKTDEWPCYAVKVVHSVDEAISLCESLYKDKECFVIGGAMIFSQFLARNIVDKMYLTEVADSYCGDTFFPNVFENWRIWYQSPFGTTANNLKYRFTIYAPRF